MGMRRSYWMHCKYTLQMSFTCSSSRLLIDGHWLDGHSALYQLMINYSKFPFLIWLLIIKCTFQYSVKRPRVYELSQTNKEKRTWVMIIDKTCWIRIKWENHYHATDVGNKAWGIPALSRLQRALHHYDSLKNLLNRLVTLQTTPWG